VDNVRSLGAGFIPILYLNSTSIPAIETTQQSSNIPQASETTSDTFHTLYSDTSIIISQTPSVPPHTPDPIVVTHAPDVSIGCIRFPTKRHRYNHDSQRCYDRVIHYILQNVNSSANQKSHMITALHGHICVEQDLISGIMDDVDIEIPIGIGTLLKIVYPTTCDVLICEQKTSHTYIDIILSLPDDILACLSDINPAVSRSIQPSYRPLSSITTPHPTSSDQLATLGGAIYFPSNCFMFRSMRLCTWNEFLKASLLAGKITVEDFIRESQAVENDPKHIIDIKPITAAPLQPAITPPSAASTLSTIAQSPVMPVVINEVRIDYIFYQPSNKSYDFDYNNGTCSSSFPSPRGLGLLTNSNAIKLLLLRQTTDKYSPNFLCSDLKNLLPIINDGKQRVYLKDNSKNSTKTIVYSYIDRNGISYGSLNASIPWYLLDSATIDLMRPFDTSDRYITQTMMSNYILNKKKPLRRKRSIFDNEISPAVYDMKRSPDPPGVHIRLLSCILNHCSSLDFDAGCNFDCDNVKDSFKKNEKCVNSAAASLLATCAQLSVVPGITGYGISTTVPNSLRVMRDVLHVGRQASNVGFLHGHHQYCYNLSDGAVNDEHSCKKIISSDINSVYFSGKSLERPVLGDMVFIPALTDTQCMEDSVYKSAIFEISTDGSYDALALSVRTMDRIKSKEVNASFCISIICDLCIVQVPMKMVGECLLHETLKSGISYSMCNQEKHVIGYSIVEHHNHPHHTTDMKYSSFFFMQIYYYIISLTPGYYRTTENKGPITRKGELAANTCQDIHFPIPDGRNYDISIKCGSKPLAVHKSLNLESACNIYSHGTPWYFPMADVICRNWIVIKYVLSTFLLGLAIFLFHITRVERIIIFCLSYIAAPFSYILYMCVPTQMTCHLCHALWTPIHKCDTLCVCGHKSSIHKCTLYPTNAKRTRVDLYEYGTFELLKAFITQSNPMTRGLTSTIYLVTLYIVICFMTPPVLAAKCCTMDVDLSLYSQDHTYHCTMSDNPVALVEVGPKKVTCPLPNDYDAVGITQVVVTGCRLSLTAEKLQVAMISFSSVDIRKAAVQCLLFNTQNQFDIDKLKLHVDNTSSELAYFNSEYKYDTYTVNVVPHVTTTAQIAQPLKAIVDSLPPLNNPKLKIDTPDLQSYYVPSSLFFTTSTNGVLNSLLKVDAKKGSGSSFILYLDGKRTPIILTINVLDVRNSYTLEYQYSTCKLQMTANSTYTCYGSNERCMSKLSYPTSHCESIKEPDSRFDTLPGCTIATVGEMCTKCFVQPIEDTCYDVYRHEYINTEVDYCLSFSSYSKCSTIIAGNIIMRPSIQVETESIPGNIQYPLVAIDKHQHCMTGPINELGSDTLAFGYPQFNYRKDLIKYECDMEVSMNWDSKNFQSTTTQCVKDFYNHVSLLSSCGHSYITTDPPSLHINPVAVGALTFSMNLPADSLKIIDKDVVIKPKKCRCTGCTDCSKGFVCELSFESNQQGNVAISSPSTTIATSSIEIHRGLNSLSVYGYTSVLSSGISLIISARGLTINTLQCQASLTTGNPNLPKGTSQEPQVVRLARDTKSYISSLLDYLNPMHFDLGSFAPTAGFLMDLLEIGLVILIAYWICVWILIYVSNSKNRVKKII